MKVRRLLEKTTKTTSDVHMGFFGTVFRALPITRTVMEYIDAINNTTVVLALLVQQVHQHQRVLEQFVKIANALTNGTHGTDAVSSDVESTRIRAEKLN